MFTIRRATSADVEALVVGNLDMARETESVQLDRDTVHAGIRALTERNEPGDYWVAVEGGRIIGQLLITFEWSDWRNRTVVDSIGARRARAAPGRRFPGAVSPRTRRGAKSRRGRAAPVCRRVEHTGAGRVRRSRHERRPLSRVRGHVRGAEARRMIRASAA